MLLSLPVGMVGGMSNPFQPDYRIGDEERRQAIEDLGAHFAAGRLDIASYEQRVDQVTAATMRSELSELFDDLPRVAQPAMPMSVASPTEPVFTASQIAQSRREGQRTRAGILGLVTVSAFLSTAILGEIGAIALFLVPTVWLLLYVMKVGPDSWYTPSVAKLQRDQLRQARMLEAQQTQAARLAHAAQVEQQKALRKQKQQELASTAMEFADETLKRFRGRHTR